LGYKKKGERATTDAMRLNDNTGRTGKITAVFKEGEEDLKVAREERQTNCLRKKHPSNSTTERRVGESHHLKRGSSS